jgi:hypothetical protein
LSVKGEDAAEEFHLAMENELAREGRPRQVRSQYEKVWDRDSYGTLVAFLRRRKRIGSGLTTSQLSAMAAKNTT